MRITGSVPVTTECSCDGDSVRVVMVKVKFWPEIFSPGETCIQAVVFSSVTFVTHSVASVHKVVKSRVLEYTELRAVWGL